MAKKRFIEPIFPFKDSEEGNFVDLARTDSKAIKSEIVHILLTNKGERLYLPDFGTNLKKFLFEPFDGQTEEEIKRDIRENITKYIPNLKIDSIEITDPDTSKHVAKIEMDYTITDEVFESKDFVRINI